MRAFHKHDGAAQRFVERRLREEEAPRLCAEMPDLLTLSLAIEDRSERGLTGYRHVRRIVVGRAAALFVIACGEPNCKDGGHDVSAAVMRSLLSRQTQFDGEDKCCGSLGSNPCARVLHYHAVAEYGARPGADHVTKS
jgi:hypothetical protein